jgi:hypothetical protein
MGFELKINHVNIGEKVVLGWARLSSLKKENTIERVRDIFTL